MSKVCPRCTSEECGNRDNGTVATGTSIGLPIMLCKQIGADFDGYTVTIISVHGTFNVHWSVMHGMVMVGLVLI